MENQSAIKWISLIFGVFFIFLFLCAENNATIQLEWETGSEIDVRGFNIYRLDNHELESPSFLGFIGKRGNTLSGEKYTFQDKNLHPGKEYQYFIEEVATNGSVGEKYGPIKGTADSWKRYGLIPGILCIILFIYTIFKGRIGTKNNQKQKKINFSIGECVIGVVGDEAFYESLEMNYEIFKIITRFSDLNLKFESVQVPHWNYPLVSLRKELLIYKTKSICAEIDFGKGYGLVYCGNDALSSDVDIFFRVIFAHLIFRKDGLLLHSSGIVRDGKAYLFVGHSGSGKTTISRFTGASDEVLSDDLVAVRKVDDRWTAFSTPFWNPVPIRIMKNLKSPIKGIYQLKKAKSTSIRRLAIQEATGVLLSNTPVITKEKHLLPQIIERCAEIANQCEVSELSFPKNDSFWATLLQH